MKTAMFKLQQWLTKDKHHLTDSIVFNYIVLYSSLSKIVVVKEKTKRDKRIELSSFGTCLYLPGPFVTLFLRLKFLHEKETRKHVTASCSRDKYVRRSKLCKIVTHGYNTHSKYQLPAELCSNSVLTDVYFLYSRVTSCARDNFRWPLSHPVHY